MRGDRAPHHPSPAGVPCTPLHRARDGRFGLLGFGYSPPVSSSRRAASRPSRPPSRRTRRELAKRLWGDLYFHPEERVFRKTPPRSPGAGGSTERSFVQFVLEPLYKMYSSVIGRVGQGDVGLG